MITHATIVPLIGGSVIASMDVFGSPPRYIDTYIPFEANETHLRAWLSQRGHEVPYHRLDDGPVSREYVDVVSTICPCAGLSSYSLSASASNPTNDWMIKTAMHILGERRPRVFWGENSPNLMGKTGRPVLEKLYEIGRENGYSLLMYGTKSLLHGSPQHRRRCFYVFIEGESVPKFHDFNRAPPTIAEVILSARGNSQLEVVNPAIPTDDPYYVYLLEEVLNLNTLKGSAAHLHFSTDPRYAEWSSRGQDVLSIIESHGRTLADVAVWMRKRGIDREADKLDRKHIKLQSGGNIMRRGTMFAKERIGAFVGHHPAMLSHPRENRYINVRESLAIMGMPQDFELIGGIKNINHVCQNVPVMTARDLANEILETLSGNREMMRSTLAFQQNGGQFRTTETKKRSGLEDFF